MMTKHIVVCHHKYNFLVFSSQAQCPFADLTKYKRYLVENPIQMYSIHNIIAREISSRGVDNNDKVYKTTCSYNLSTQTSCVDVLTTMDMLRRIGICLVLCTCLSATSARGDYVLASTDAQRDTTKQQNYEMNQIEATGEELHEGINSNGFEEPRITQDREKRRPFVPLVPHLPLYPHVRPHHGSEEPTEAIEAFHGHYSPNFLVDAPPHEKSIQSEFDHTFIEKQLRSKERGGSVELFARQSNHVECDMYSTPRYSCYNCYNYMECKDSGGKIKPCKDPLAPYCNGGVCSAVPGPQC